MIKDDDKYIRELFSYLVLNSSGYSDLGLFHGKMGLVLFFMNYARYVCDEQYENFALNLLSDIYEEINESLPIGLENGLCGIGWGIEYLIQNEFLEGETDEILKEIDQKIVEHNVFNISDLSFRKGLGGVVFYIIARLLASKRKKMKFPFSRAYLYALKKRLLHVSFEEKDEILVDLFKIYCGLLDGKMCDVISIPDILICRNIPVVTDLSLLPLGLENGIAGFLLYQIQEKKFPRMTKIVQEKISQNKTIVIFNEESQASNYGIGTYISNLIKALQDTDCELLIFHIGSYRGKTIFLEVIDGVPHYFVAAPRNRVRGQIDEQNSKLYYRSVLFVIYPILRHLKSIVFQLNYMKMDSLASELKSIFPFARVILTVHYIEWRFRLMGDKNEFRRILNKEREKRYITIFKSFKREKTLLETCDQVVAVAKHSYNDLLDFYQVPIEKLSCISHGIKDEYLKLSRKDFLSLRKKYGYKESDRIIIIAGRLSTDKGCEIVAKAFAHLAEEYPLLHLIVVGSGGYETILSHIAPYWSRVSFTGYINKQFLYELYAISDIGISPSFYEEFGYVVLEMMMMELPVIVSQTTGLSELVLNSETGIAIPIFRNKMNDNVNHLKSMIKRLLDNPLLCKQYARKGRIRYLQQYNWEQFKMSYIRLLQEM